MLVPKPLKILKILLRVLLRVLIRVLLIVSKRNRQITQLPPLLTKEVARRPQAN